MQQEDRTKILLFKKMYTLIKLPVFITQKEGNHVYFLKRRVQL